VDASGLPAIFRLMARKRKIQPEGIVFIKFEGIG
jgi:hypothetical protein